MVKKTTCTLIKIEGIHLAIGKSWSQARKVILFSSVVQVGPLCLTSGKSLPWHSPVAKVLGADLLLLLKLQGLLAKELLLPAGLRRLLHGAKVLLLQRLLCLLVLLLQLQLLQLVLGKLAGRHL